MSSDAPIAVVGMGGIFPGAADLAAFWRNIAAKVDTVREVPAGRWVLNPRDALADGPEPDKVYSLRACLVDDFTLDPAGLDVDPHLLQRLDPLYHMVLHAGRAAFLDGMTAELNRDRVGVILAAIALPTDGSSAMTRDVFGRAFENALLDNGVSAGTQQRRLYDTDQQVDPCHTGQHVHPLNGYVVSLPAALLAQALGLGGGSYTLDAACASSLYALKLACEELRGGRADAMLAGGVSRPDCLYTQMGFSQLRALSRSGRCAPFDETSDGLVVGEGAGIVLLKRLDDAIRDGDRICGVIRGIGLSNDIGGSLLAPDSEGQLRAMHQAYDASGWSPLEVDLIECHGTGTPLGDAVEIRSLCTLWGETGWRPRQCPIGSVKSMIGHLLTGAGAAGLIKTLLALREKTLPPSANYERSGSVIPLEGSPFRVQTEAAEWSKRSAAPRRAAVNAFGFGGINAHVLLEEWREENGETSKRRNVETTVLGMRQISSVARASRPCIHRRDGSATRVVGRTLNGNSPVAIVGMSARFGSVSSLREFDELLFNGRSAIQQRPVDRWWGCDEQVRHALDGRAMPGAYLEQLSIPVGKYRFPPNEIPEVLPQQLLMLDVMAAAMEDAGMAGRARRPRVGVIVGAALDFEACNFHLRWWLRGQARHWAKKLGLALSDGEETRWIEALCEAAGPALNASRTVGALGNIIASRIARDFSLGGPSFAVSCDEASGLRALEVAVRALQRGEMDTVIVGAVDLAGDARAVLMSHEMRAFSTLGEVRPFDTAADGTVVGEGAAAVVLKRLDDSRKAEDRVYAVVRGLGCAGGGNFENTKEGGRVYGMALDRAYADACVGPDSIGYVEAHGSGDPREDSAEAMALKTFFESCPRPPAVGSVKPNVGHTGAAAGMASLVKTCLCLYRGLIPPLQGFEGPPTDVRQHVDRPHMATDAQPWSSSFMDMSPAKDCGNGVCGTGVSPVFCHGRDARATGDSSIESNLSLAGVSAMTLDGNCVHVVLEGPERPLHDSDTGVLPVTCYAPEADQPEGPAMVVRIGREPLRPPLPEQVGVNVQREGRLETGRPAGPGALVTAATPRPRPGAPSSGAALTRAAAATTEAHNAFLRFSQTATEGMQKTLAIQSQLIDKIVAEEDVGSEVLAELTARKRAVLWEPDALSDRAEIPQREDRLAGPRALEDGVQGIQDFPRELCLEFARGSVEKVLGAEYAVVDTYPVRVRLPDEPLMLVDRILSVEGVKGSLTSGTIVTEHDVRPGAWYLDGGRFPVSMTVEAGQADLFLCSYLGIDQAVEGRRTYRLLDATVTFHRGLPRAGDVIRYEITIDRFVRQGETYLFFFRFDGMIDGELMLTMRNGCAGFFTVEEIEHSGGIVLTAEDTAQIEGRRAADWRELVPMTTESYDDAAVAALREGNLAGCFGRFFKGLALRDPLRLPDGRLKLFDRVLELNPGGGRFGLGIIRTEADIHPNDWFLTCHFVDDMTMPGTLMYECCLHALRFYLLRMGWIGEQAGVCYEPIPGISSALRCRGPVTEKTKKVVYQVEIKEIGYRPEPYVIADALMFADGERIVQMNDMSLLITGLGREQIEATWRGRQDGSETVDRAMAAVIAVGEASSRGDTPRPRTPRPGALEGAGRPTPKQVLFDKDRILAFAIGKPSEAFGEPYRVFDDQRRIARLPGPPYQFLDRITEIEPTAWQLEPGGWIEAQYDVPPDAWYFRANRQASMPFCILLEVALQPCGWLAAYLGSALRSETDLSFRNLGGRATLHEEVFPDAGTLATRVRLTNVSEAGGMIIEKYDMRILREGRTMYEGETSFGFFSKEALAQQVGIRDAGQRAYRPIESLSPNCGTKNCGTGVSPVCHHGPEARATEDMGLHSREELARGRLIKMKDVAPLTPIDPDGAIERGAALPGRALRMIDEVEVLVPDGGPHGLGYVRGAATVNTDAWFFKAHFYQDPVWPGSLGLESFLQLLKVYALDRWDGDREGILGPAVAGPAGGVAGRAYRFEPIALGVEHTWTYRGQIIPGNKRVEVDAVITKREDGPKPMLLASGFLKVDGVYIYEMVDFGLRLVRE